MIAPDLYARLCRIAETRARAQGDAPAHDFLHVQRVVANSRRLAVAEGARLEVVVLAALLHELFNYPKGHPESHLSGEVCAEHARDVLFGEGCSAELVEAVAYAIRVHPFSRGIHPETLEAKILQDADRLDAIGAIGIARCFATCSEMKRPFYAPDDPFCAARPPEDKLWGVDHFYKKLLRIPDTLNTAGARAIAAERIRFMEAYLAQLALEVHDANEADAGQPLAPL